MMYMRQIMHRTRTYTPVYNQDSAPNAHNKQYVRQGIEYYKVVPRIILYTPSTLLLNMIRREREKDRRTQGAKKSIRRTAGGKQRTRC